MLFILFFILTTTVLSDQLSTDDISTILKIHNDERTSIGFVNLTWNNSLAIDSDIYAQSCNTVHSDVKHENLAWGSPFISAFDAVNLWLFEKFDETGVVGHYLQMTHVLNRQVGCGRAICGENWYMYVCRYRRPRIYQRVWAWNDVQLGGKTTGVDIEPSYQF